MKKEIVIEGKIESREVSIGARDHLLTRLDPKPSQMVYNHSPDGFSWGYGGSGPAQLALAILLRFTTKDIALKNYQPFKWEVIARLPQEDFRVLVDISPYLK